MLVKITIFDISKNNKTMDAINKLFSGHFHGNHMTLPTSERKSMHYYPDDTCHFCGFSKSEFMSKTDYKGERVSICYACEIRLPECAECFEIVNTSEPYKKINGRFFHPECHV